MDSAVPDDHRVKMKYEEKRENYLEELEDDGDINNSMRARNSLHVLGKEIGGIGK